MGCKAGEVLLEDSWEEISHIYGGTLSSTQKAGIQGPFVVEGMEDPCDKDRWWLKKMSQFFKGRGLDTETKVTPFLLPPAIAHPHKVRAYFRCPWPKWGKCSAPSVSLSELPSSEPQTHHAGEQEKTERERAGKCHSVRTRMFLNPHGQTILTNELFGPGLGDLSVGKTSQHQRWITSSFAGQRFNMKVLFWNLEFPSLKGLF